MARRAIGGDATASSRAVTPLSAKIASCFLLCIALWLGGLFWFVARLPPPLPANARADAIVVLTGGSLRLEYGVQLLAENRSDHLFISGVGESATAESLLRRLPAPVRAQLDADDMHAIALGHQAVNTIGNASETVRWLKNRHFTSILLVTAATHMPRSILEFEQADPGLAITPAPVFPDESPATGWWRHSESRLFLLSEYHKFLAASLRHWLVRSIS